MKKLQYMINIVTTSQTNGLTSVLNARVVIVKIITMIDITSQITNK